MIRTPRCVRDHLVLVVALLAATSVLLPVRPAAAHPFGPPASADVSVEGRQVTIEWRAAADDYAALGNAAGLIEDPVPDPTLETAPAAFAEELDAAQQERLQGAPELEAYIAERLVVRQDGDACDRTAVVTGSLFDEGLVAQFRCPAVVETVDIDVTLLTDVHAAYRTVAQTTEAAAPTKTLYTAERTSVAWRFGAGASPATPVWQLGLLAVGSAAAVAAAGAALARRRTDRRST